MFNATTTMAMAAYFLSKQKDPMLKLKLLKLLYLAERDYLLRYGYPVTGDKLVSKRYGPVLSQTLNLLNAIERHYAKDALDESNSGVVLWVKYFEYGSKRRSFALRADEAELDKLFNYGLSRACRQVADDVWKKFGQMSRNELIAYVHDPANCPEWRAPGKSVAPPPIHYKEIFVSGGYSEAEAKNLDKHIRDLESSYVISQV